VTERLEGKVAIVTGAGSGLGKAAAIRFACEGAGVGCVDIVPESAAATAAAISGDGRRALAVTADVSRPEDAERMTQETADAFGPIDILYANAGIAGIGDAMSMAPETWDRVIAVNLTGVWLSDKYVLPYMVERGRGSIINQASIGGLIGVPGIAPYAAAKGGIIGLTKQMAVEFGPHNVRVNAVCPGTVPTPLVTATYEERAGIGGAGATVAEGLAAATERYPIGRLGTADEIASLALFLASDEASWITGGVFVVDGGYTAA